MSERIFLSPPHMTGNEKKYIDEAFATNWISPLGHNLDKFEADMNDYLGEGYAVAMSSGTAAIHIALLLAGVGPGDKVLCSSFTFIASANPIIYCGAEPVFIDSEKETWNLCPSALKKALEEEKNQGVLPKALVVVDLLGLPAKYDEILDVCSSYGIKVIEDSAESLGASYKGKKCGLFGDFGVFSFNGNKILSTSGGGMLICHTEDDAKKAKHLITQARDNAPYYLHSRVGYNYRMSNIVAGIGVAQLQVIDMRVEQRKRNLDYYKRELQDISEISFMPVIPNGKPNNWLTSIVIEPTSRTKPEDIINALAEDNIEARHIWKPLHTQPVFSKCRYYSNGENVSEKVFESAVSLPSGSALTDDELLRVCRIIKKLFNH